MPRIDWDRYFMNIARDVALRSTCIRKGRQVGTVIVNDHHEIVATGYNGNPRGMEHCEKIGCVREKLGIPSGERAEICTAVHSEQNALIQAGTRSRGSTMYTLFNPCNTCAKMIANAGILRVVYSVDYPERMGLRTLRDCDVRVKRLR
ncbi:MAG: dCMP deaminase family protein [Euryarchaeota archaeon]|nr:dCMP deaminase family protein [Euryarchaeota archaeon]